MKTRFRFNTAVTCIALAVVLTPALLFAHARLVRSVPAVNARVSTSPASVSLWFSERSELRYTSIELVDSAGVVIPHGPITSIDSMGVTAPITATLSPGRYSVAWRTAAADAHGTSGRFAFVVVSDSASAPPAVGARDTIVVKTVGANAPIQSGADSGFSTSVRWAELVGAITLIGAVLFRLFTLPRADWPDPAMADVSERLRRLAGAVLVLLMIAAAMRFRATLDLMTASEPAASGIRGMMPVNPGWLFLFIGGVVVGVGFIWARASRAGWMLMTLGVVGICLGEALTGHAGSMPRYLPLSVATDVTHFLAAGGWIGGLACLAMCGLPALRSVDTVLRDVAGARLVRSFHRSAMQCVVLVLASALIAAWLRLNALSDLWTTDYGSTLFRKIMFVLVVMGFGAYHWRTAVIPDWDSKTSGHFQRTAIVELIVSAIVLAFTAFLVSTALPNHP